MTKGLYIGTVSFISLVIVVITILITKKRSKNKILKIISELEKEKNMLINVPVLSELSKASALISNSKLKEKYDNWKLQLDQIEKETIPDVNEMLIDIDFLVDKGKKSEIYEQITEIEVRLYEIKLNIKNILSEIKEITLSEERNRATVIKLKALYRKLKLY